MVAGTPTTATTVTTGRDGSIRWLVDGALHRDNGPALILPGGVKAWYRHGALHRLDGPAVVYPNGDGVWFVHGERLVGFELEVVAHVYRGHTPGLPHSSRA